MFPLAGQTAEPNGPIFFVDTQEWPGGDKLKKNFVPRASILYGKKNVNYLSIKKNKKCIKT